MQKNCRFLVEFFPYGHLLSILYAHRLCRYLFFLIFVSDNCVAPAPRGVGMVTKRIMFSHFK